MLILFVLVSFTITCVSSSQTEHFGTNSGPSKEVPPTVKNNNEESSNSAPRNVSLTDKPTQDNALQSNTTEDTSTATAVNITRSEDKKKLENDHELVDDLFSSTFHLKEAVKFVSTSDIYNNLDRYIRQNELRLARLRRTLTEIDEQERLLSGEDFRITHPVFTYKFVRRQAKIVEKVLQEVNVSGHDGSLTFNRDMFDNFRSMLPTEEDLQGAVIGILRIITTYRLNTERVSTGILGNYKSRALTAAECFDMARYTISVDKVPTNKFVATLLWLDEATQRVNNGDKSTNIVEILSFAISVFENEGCNCTTDVMRIRIRLAQAAPNLKPSLLHNPECEDTPKESCRAMYKPWGTYRSKRFDALCRGETTPPPEGTQIYYTPEMTLSCYYTSRGHPWLLLQPIKIEQLNRKPYVAILHDVITNAEIKFVMKTSKPHIKRGTMLSKEGSAKTNHKISKTTVIPKRYIRFYLKNLQRRLAAIIGLNQKGFESLTVANYGVGGYYGPHVDVLSEMTVHNFTIANDNRLATFVMYLNEVEMGGATVFPYLGVKSLPKRGNALLFFNLNKNGDSNHYSEHGSCPVIYGEKWITNQWVTRYEQEFTYPCSLHEYD